MEEYVFDKGYSGSKTENLREEKQNDKENYRRSCQRLSLHTWALEQGKLEEEERTEISLDEFSNK